MEGAKPRVVDCFDDVPEFQMAMRVQEARRQRLVVREDHQAQSERRSLLNQALAEAKAELARLQEETLVRATATTLVTSSQSRTPFVAHCEECGIEHSSLVGDLYQGNGKWYCNGCWIKWDLPEPVPEEEAEWSGNDIVFDEDDGISPELPDHLDEIREELFGSDETKTIPLITGILAICYSDDPEKRALGSEVYEKVKHLNRETEDVSDGKITRRILEGGCSWIRALLDDDDAFAKCVEEIRRE